MIDAGVVDPAPRVREALRAGFIERIYPVLTSPGVRDEDVLVHSLGLSLWTLLGHTLGYAALVEAPAPAAVGADIRNDVAWLDRDLWQPRVLVEFERFEGGARGDAKLIEKLRNLLEAATRWQARSCLLVLSVWSTGVVNAPRTEVFRTLLREGFCNSAGIRIQGQPGITLLLHRLLLSAALSGRLRLGQSLLEEVR